ncbi:glycosyltransferase family 2 protein [Arthrobacter psychrochitiniphilus]|uniref:glycosyltransferase family 2 protein n=1 Tax=Arthrobacter psychrochitiniphilus TaxID=291045 RepID=UPI003F7CB427
MVAHNGGAYLPAVLAALAAQTHQPDQVLAADVGSTDDSGELLRKELGERHVISLEARKGYGSAVNAVLEHQMRLHGAAVLPARTARHGAQGPSGGVGVLEEELPTCNEWIWLLQDDAAPALDALQLLIEATERATTATVVGCKQLDWDNHRRLVDVGLRANKWFDRFSLVGLDEQDQGQYDHLTDMFAVNTAGMLVRRDVFERLGGFDPALPGPGDDLDFCARVRMAGDRVLVVPAAHMFHVVHRPNGVGSAVAARKAGIFLRLKHAPAWGVPLLCIGTFFSAIYWLLAGFVLKAPGHAVRMFIATCAGLMHPLALRRSRASLAATRTQRRSVHKGLHVPERTARDHLKMLRESVGPEEHSSEDILEGPSLLEPTGESHRENVTPLAATRTAPIISGLALVVVLGVLALVALSRFLGVPALMGGALLPLSADIGTIWSHATDWWISLGSGMPGRGNPFNFILFLLGALGGNASLSVLWLVLLALPLSAFTAWLAAGALTLRRWPRVVAALGWAGAPALLIALGQGRVGALLAHILIPIVMLGMIRAVGGAVSPESVPGTVEGALPSTKSATAKSATSKSAVFKLGRPGVGGNPSWTAAAAAGLALAVVCAAAPSLFVVAVVGVLAATVLLGRRGRTIWWSLLPTAALFLPFVWSAWENPRALLADPGLPLAATQGPLWQQILGFPLQLDTVEGVLGLGAAPWLTGVFVGIIGVPVVAAAVIALLLPLRRAAMVRSLWLLALLALGVSYGGKLLAVAFDGGTLVTVFNGPAVSLAFFALLGAALVGFDAIHRQAYEPSRTSKERHPAAKATAVVLSVVLVAAPVASLGAWTVQQFSSDHSGAALSGPFLLEGATAGTIPATAADRGTGPEASRTIVLTVRPDGSIDAALMQGAGTTLDSLSGISAAARITGAPGNEAILASDAPTQILESTVAALVSKSGIDPRNQLVDLGVGFVVLRPGDTAAELLASELEGVPGLNSVGPTESGWLWRVAPSYTTAGDTDVVNRVRLVDAGGKATSPVPSNGLGVKSAIAAGAPGRTVVMAERADSQWQAWLNGKPLKPVTAGWAQAFELPASAGTLEIRYIQPLDAVFTIVMLLIFGLTILLAVPVRARRGRTGAYRDEASLQRVGRRA